MQPSTGPTVSWRSSQSSSTPDVWDSAITSVDHDPDGPAPARRACGRRRRAVRTCARAPPRHRPTRRGHRAPSAAMGARTGPHFPRPGAGGIQGSWSTDVMALSSTSGALLDWLERQLTVGPVEGCGRPPAHRAARRSPSAICCRPGDQGGGDGTSRRLAGRLPARAARGPRPRHPRSEHARIDVAADGVRQQVLAAAARQLAGEVEPVKLPGGRPVDDVSAHS